MSEISNVEIEVTEQELQEVRRKLLAKKENYFIFQGLN